MKSTATLTYVLALSVSTTTLLFTGSNSCPGDPVLAVAAACQRVNTGQPMLELCAKTLHAANGNTGASKVCYYAYLGAAAAMQSSSDTEHAGRQLLKNPSLSKELRAAYSYCINRYGVAKKKINLIGQALYNCGFPTFKQDCTDAVAAIEDCARKLRAVDSFSHLYKLALTDRDLTTITCSLAHLGEAGH